MLAVRKSKGFTLVELLVVIIIIGILAGAIMLVAGGSTAKSEATKIVENLRAMKSASLMYYGDKGGYPSFRTNITPTSSTASSYMDRDPGTLYVFSNTGMLVWCDVTGADKAEIRTKLVDMATSAGLLGATAAAGEGATAATPATPVTFVATDSFVGMKVY